MNQHQQALLEFLAYWCLMGAVLMPVYMMRHKIKRERQWRKIK